ncbi:MAG: hypothetical protein IJZ36_03610 [Bacilli bacterium]|nr:hypothetical protein [Bacilli bacterium]
MNEITYAVGKYYYHNDIDLESLKYFDNQSSAVNYYLNHLNTDLFNTTNMPVLAIFMIKNNMIINANYLMVQSEEVHVGPVGPISAVKYMN